MPEQNQTPLAAVLNHFREASQTEREKGTYFEELIIAYLKNEAFYKDLYSDVWTYSAWANQQGLDKRDTGIDLVAQTRATQEFHAIQCKFFDAHYHITKKDIDSFFTASGKKPFVHRIIVTTTANWTEHAQDALQNQQPPVNKIDLFDLEASQIDWAKYQSREAVTLKPQKTLREHQTLAVSRVLSGLEQANRGKLIMACGTGKTFTSLKIAEKIAGAGKRVLFLVPSLALLSQTLTEWTQESHVPLHSFAVCSDSEIGKKRKKGSADDDSVQTFMHELRFPATTQADRLTAEMNRRYDTQHMNVVFSTYHSIDVISKAQKEHGLSEFDLIICDEAHRTTGATFEGENESNFVRVHDNAYIRATKRLYMTATPRIYGEAAKATAKDQTITLCSMDDETLYGKELYIITFSEAVARGLLVDYKVIVLAVEEKHVNTHLQKLLTDENKQLRLDDASKIVGCWKALSKQDTREDLSDDEQPMQRAVAFCQVIEPAHERQSKSGKAASTHKVSSKNIAQMFSAVVEAYQDYEKEQLLKEAPDTPLAPALSMVCDAKHVDGSMSATEKEEKLIWLKAKEGLPENTCRILSNVRCLSEGVDVPALDAVLFLTPRNSQVDVVQSVGRVMRNAPGKKRGYVILPVVIPYGVEAHEALNDNKVYGVVWQVLQALRSHDDRFDARINRMEFDGIDPSRMEVIAVTDRISPKTRQPQTAKEKNAQQARSQQSIGVGITPPPEQYDLHFQVGEIERAIYAKIVKKVGRADYWDEWGKEIGTIAKSHISRITTILENPNNTAEINAFNAFAQELRDDLNDSITDGDVIEMLAQHLITKPVFDALFQDEDFTRKNPISQAMQTVLETLEKHHIEKEAQTLQGFYESIKRKADGVQTVQGKQKIVLELYDKFFRNAFPKMAERLGIVYTPVEVVDFIIHSINDVLQDEFGQTLGSKNVHIIDPFTGTGTFITRLLQSGLISKEQLPHKYKNEIHANEIVLLAYYIAAINIESTYHSIAGGGYTPFEGICLTDTFELYEKEDLVSNILEDNSKRRARQKKLDIRVIMGNPPYSSGQKSENDNNANIAYPLLDERIGNTYAKNSEATLQKNLYDSYIRAIRWASDRIKNAGIIGFVTNAGWIDSNSADGMRKCLAEEFSNIYIFHLRGNQRTSGEISRKEGGKIFGSGSRAPIAISLLVKNPGAASHGNIYFHDIGDYLTREEKLQTIADFASIKGIAQQNGWQIITPDQHNDWLNQRDERFYDYISMGDKKNETAIAIFENYSQGVLTARDAWCYNSSKSKLAKNISSMINFYNAELQRYQELNTQLKIDDFINTDSTKISWTDLLKRDLEKQRSHSFQEKLITPSLYRPFTVQNLYFSKDFNQRQYQLPQIFPTTEAKNLVICLTVTGTKGFSVMVSNLIPDNHSIGDAQCFPLYLYDILKNEQQDKGSLFADEQNNTGLKRRDAITDEGLAHFQKAYPTETISKEDLFYYIYGLLHSEDYRLRYADNLTKELPRIPAVKKAQDFWRFSKAGRALAELHLNYETVEPYPVDYREGKLLLDTLDAKDFRVEKMRFGKAGKEEDKTTVIYNPKITMTNIPLAAYDYIVNGKPALEWVMERQSVTTHKDSGIVNDANDWAIETMHNPRYPLELFQRVITVSLETMKIVHTLPDLKYLTRR